MLRKHKIVSESYPRPGPYLEMAWRNTWDGDLHGTRFLGMAGTGTRAPAGTLKAGIHLQPAGGSKDLTGKKGIPTRQPSKLPGAVAP
jgi:hypothetical protein